MQDSLKNRIRFYLLARYYTIRKFCINFTAYIDHAREAAESEAHTKMATQWAKGVYLRNYSSADLQDHHVEEDYNEVFIPPQSQVYVEGDGYSIVVTNNGRADKTMNWNMRIRSEVKHTEMPPPLFEESEEEDGNK